MYSVHGVEKVRLLSNVVFPLDAVFQNCNKRELQAIWSPDLHDFLNLIVNVVPRDLF